jgi:hypothetical protein
MLIWLILAIVLGFLGIMEYLMGFSVPFPLLRTVMIFLIIIGMSYRIYQGEGPGTGGQGERVRDGGVHAFRGCGGVGGTINRLKGKG